MKAKNSKVVTNVKASPKKTTTNRAKANKTAQAKKAAPAKKNAKRK